MKKSIGDLWDEFAGCNDTVSEQLYLRLRKVLTPTALKMLNVPSIGLKAQQEAEDVVAKVLARKVWLDKQQDNRALLKIDNPTGFLIFWIRLACLDIIKRSHLGKGDEQGSDKQPPGPNDGELQEFIYAMNAYLASLPEIEQKAWEHHFEEWPVSEISHQLGLTHYKTQQILNKIADSLKHLYFRYQDGKL